MENGNRGRVVAVDATAGTLKVELPGDRTVTLPRDYLGRRTARGEPTIVHGYAGTAHIAQGSTTARAFVLGSDADEHHAGVVQGRQCSTRSCGRWSRAALSARRSSSSSAPIAVRVATRRRRLIAQGSCAGTHRPTSSRRSAIVRAHAARAGAWDRAVEIIERHRAADGVTDPEEALGQRPTELLAQVAWRRARRSLDEARRTLSRSASIELIGGLTD